MDDLDNQDGFTNLIEKDEGKEPQIVNIVKLDNPRYLY